MSLFRGDRVLSHFLRHDPFSPFTRPSLSPFYSPFFTVFDEPRTLLYDHPHQQSLPPSSSPQGSSKASPSSSTKANSNSQEVTRTGHDESQVERSPHRRHPRGRHAREDHPLSLWGGSPFTGSAFPSLFNTAMAPFAASVQAVPDITVDVHSTPQAYAIHAAVPGMDKNDIKVTVDDGVLTIEAERRATRGRQPTTNSTTNSTASPSASSPSAASSAPSTAGTQPTAEMKTEESKEEKTDSAAQSAVDGASSSAATTATGNGPSAMEEDPEDFHYTETYYGRVERSIQLPEDARVDELTAKYENGVLKIDIPRVQEQKPKGRRVEIQ